MLQLWRILQLQVAEQHLLVIQRTMLGMSIELALTIEEEGEGNYAEVAAGKWALGKWDCCITPWKLLDRSLESAAPRFQLSCTGQWRVLRIGCVMYLKKDGLIYSYIPRSISFVLLKTVANDQLLFWLWLHLFLCAHVIHNEDKALTTHQWSSGWSCYMKDITV